MFHEFSGYKLLKKSAEKILLARYNEEFGFLNNALSTNGWLSGQKLCDFEAGLESMSWKENEEVIVSLAEGILTKLQKLEEKYRGRELDLYVLEEGLHEF